MKIKMTPRVINPRNNDPVWMCFECGAGSRWMSTEENSHGTVCQFSGCNCGTTVNLIKETSDRSLFWFGLRVGKSSECSVASGAFLRYMNRPVAKAQVLAWRVAKDTHNDTNLFNARAAYRSAADVEARRRVAQQLRAMRRQRWFVLPRYCEATAQYHFGA